MKQSEGVVDALTNIIKVQGDIGHVALFIVLAAALYALKLLRDDLKECATNYINDSRLSTAAYTEMMTVFREMKANYTELMALVRELKAKNP